MDMDEVATFFKNLIQTKTLNIATLPMIGFMFLSNYFLSANEEKGNLEKLKPAVKETPKSTGWFIMNEPTKKKDEEKDEVPEFKIKTDPSQLIDLEIIWTLALESRNEEVCKQAIVFLVNCYTSLDVSLESKKTEF